MRLTDAFYQPLELNYWTHRRIKCVCKFQALQAMKKLWFNIPYGPIMTITGQQVINHPYSLCHSAITSVTAAIQCTGRVAIWKLHWPQNHLIGMTTFAAGRPVNGYPGACDGYGPGSKIRPGHPQYLFSILHQAMMDLVLMAWQLLQCWLLSYSS